jgi:hypothetical protein
MKPLTLFSRTRALIARGMSAGLLMNQPIAAAGKPHLSIERPMSADEEDKPAKKTAGQGKSSSSRNNNAVKIFPDILKRDMHVVAKENKGKTIDFFVFDLEGTLIQNYRMKEKDHIRIAGLSRGKYIYRVFCGDDEMAHGDFEIR